MKKRGFGFAVGVSVIIFAACMGLISLFGTSTVQRALKSVSSDFDGGLNRTVYFDNEDGKRVIIHGGIVINEEN